MAINKPVKWLITGGCGFIGTRLIKNLIAEDRHFIQVLDNLTVGTRDDLGKVCSFTEETSGSKDVKLMVGDITGEQVCLDAAKDMDVIVHLAANTGVGPSVKDPKADMTSNVIGTFNMLEAARTNKVKRFIFASSGAPAGECEPPIHEELAPHPVSPYGASKLAGEGYCSAYFKTFGIETIPLRFGNVYGPGSGHKNSVVAKFIKQAMKGETLEIYGDGTQTRDFIYIDDLIHAVRRAQSVPSIGGETFQIASNRETTILEMVNILVPVLENAGIKNINIQHGKEQLGDVMRNFSDTSKAKSLLNWRSKYSLEQGIVNTVK
ncbi:MAG: NAD-dependent epimerase/dehydratase family protein, partial [Desulfobacula sp.]|nr:NAD-dependent epimerase/dehydratase family protein [Desulfobacula sp.]